MTKQEKADCRKIADHYGWKVEKAKLIEEMGELKEAMEDWSGVMSFTDGLDEVPYWDASLDHIAEETADVEICLCHIEHLGGKDFGAKVAEYRKQKIARQLQRMEAWE